MQSSVCITFFLFGYKKSLIGDGAEPPCNSTTCTQFTPIRQNSKIEEKQNYFTSGHNPSGHKKATIYELQRLVVSWLLLGKVPFAYDCNQPSAFPLTILNITRQKIFARPILKKNERFFLNYFHSSGRWIIVPGIVSGNCALANAFWRIIFLKLAILANS